MQTFDVYFPIKFEERLLPGVVPNPKTIEQIVELTKHTHHFVDKYRAGNKKCKLALPAVCWTGRCLGNRRSADAMEATQFVMLDIDHCENVDEANAEISSAMLRDNVQLAISHVTPSGSGLRFVVRATEPIDNLSGYMKMLCERYDLNKYGKFDTAVKDLSRLSFLPKYTDIRFINHDILGGNVSYTVNPIKSAGESIKPSDTTEVEDKREPVSFSEEELEEYASRLYSGIPYATIVEDYVKAKGIPQSGDKHNFYNEMVKNFRTICDNDKKFLLWLLPRFGHSVGECWSQINSICRVNTLSRIPAEFYYFLKDNGYLRRRQAVEADSEKEAVEVSDAQSVMPPYLPPVFRELLTIAPPDFVVPAMNALLPIMGTLTSYLRATYPYDGREHSTSFFSVIYAPAGSGKGFVERYMDILFRDLKIRDAVQSERENVYLRAMQRKGANDKAPDRPHTSLRIIPAKNSEAEFLEKMRDNNGYHMFTFAAEMDSWAKGVRAAGGNKDDMIRIAWDNGEYGQQFKSFNTFKGMVRLYWNVLITGTLAQLETYFKNVENGLVTRCSFTSIENQEFSLPAKWRNISSRGMEVVKNFMARCDAMTYQEPCTIDISELLDVKDDDFDNVVDWRFTFRPFKKVDMSWLMPTIDEFNSREMERAAKDFDKARDVFRRRVAVRGFRLGIMCYALWAAPRASDLQKCCAFVKWWMDQDLQNILKLWGSRYNEQADMNVKVTQRSLYSCLGETFTREDVYVQCTKQGVRTPVRRVIHDWRRLGLVVEVEKNCYKKKAKK